MAVTIKLCLMEGVGGGEVGGVEKKGSFLKKKGEKNRHSERHISSRLRRSDSVKRVCRKRKREGKGVGRCSGGREEGRGG